MPWTILRSHAFGAVSRVQAARLAARPLVFRAQGCRATSCILVRCRGFHRLDPELDGEFSDSFTTWLSLPSRIITPCLAGYSRPAAPAPHAAGGCLAVASEDEPEVVAEPSQSARQRLVDWANQQDGWVRSIVAEVLATRRSVSEEALGAVRNQYLVEKQLAEGKAPSIATLGADGASGDSTEPLALTYLRGCDGVNALATGQDITFNPRMTVLFGENAAGKTGYVRVLKLLANVRSAEPIIRDIHRPSAPSTPEALVGFKVGSTEDELPWRGERGVTPFTRMTVFDSPAVALHLEDNVTYVYTPADLALFGYVHAAIEAVRTLLQRDMNDRLPKQNPFLTAFARGTGVYPRIEGLSGSTNLADLETLAAVSDEERTELDALKTSVEALSSASGAQTEMLRGRATVMRNLITVGNALVAFDASAFSEAVETEASARTTQTEAAAAVFGGGQLPDELRPAWQQFVEAGEQYLVASNRTGYPETDDICIYCQQALGDAARTLLRSYRSYASGVAAAALRTATERVTSFQQSILGAEVSAAIEGLRATLPGLSDAEMVPDWVSGGQALLTRAETVHSAVQRRGAVAAPEGADASAALIPRLTVALQEAETAIQGLEGDATERQRLLGEQRTKVSQLEARLRLSQLMPDIRKYVDDAAWADRLRTLLGRFQALLTGLTTVSKLASEDVLNHDFERMFYEECKALRAPTVTLDFPGRRGQAARRKSVTRDHSLDKILSEGEQKVIAIADFLAEASLRTGSAPIVFDDPVDSFDYRRVEEIARRIATLSAQHQVIVFTHDIVFTAELLAEFERRTADCLYYQVVADGGHKGIVSRAAHPRLDSLASVRGRINAAIQDAESGPDEDRQHRIDSAYSEVRAWCEIVVETRLLNKVTQRYKPNVAMQNLSDIKVGGLQQAIEVIYPIWEKANRYTTAHSQPLGTLSIRPTVSELKQHWAALQQALKDYDES